jgi:hypothetical protein
MLNKKGENMDISYMSEFDMVRFKQSGRTYEGVIEKVVNANEFGNAIPFIELKFYEVDEIGKRVGYRSNGLIYATSFEGLEMEWWYEGQGGDYLISGYWEKVAYRKVVSEPYSYKSYKRG